MSERPVWITGAGGLIGNYLTQTAPGALPSGRVRALTRAELELTNFAAVREMFRKESPQLVIHCAALANTSTCEKNHALARKLNVEVTAVLAELATGIPFIFFSTDLVFDGLAGNYDESANVNPLSVYAKTKVEAERIVLANPKHTVLRTSLNFGKSLSGDRAFNEQMRHALERGETLNLFTDEFRCPIPAAETARVVWELAAQNKPGLYHVAGAERLSRWQIGGLLTKYWCYGDPKMEPGSLKDFRGLPRSPDTSLNCAKVQNLLSSPLPRFSEWLGA
ncbi:MAG TPA: SDR family oxidoreductase [Verrucomicrobiae bacterium]|jgi:dTDP-4-dehydrorhamnose reductase|nr:SDR family oxidoreductase [Verrucomicrobiae bacterium]